MNMYTRSRAHSGGFTLIELTVVVAIFALMTTVVLSNYGSFRNASALHDLAYEIALTIRQAQSYGISAQAFGGSFNTPYGVYVSSGDPSHLYLFADQNNDRAYEPDELVTLFSLNNGNIVSDFSVTNGVQTLDKNANGLTSLYIFFKRPDPDACIMSSADPGDCTIGNVSLQGGYQQGTITISDPSGDTDSITINSTGQVSIAQ